MDIWATQIGLGGLFVFCFVFLFGAKRGQLKGGRVDLEGMGSRCDQVHCMKFLSN